MAGISSRRVGQVLDLMLGEPVSVETVSRITQQLDTAVACFHARPSTDDGAHSIQAIRARLALDATNGDNELQMCYDLGSKRCGGLRPRCVAGKADSLSVSANKKPRPSSLAGHDTAECRSVIPGRYAHVAEH